MPRRRARRSGDRRAAVAHEAGEPLAQQALLAGDTLYTIRHLAVGCQVPTVPETVPMGSPDGSGRKCGVSSLLCACRVNSVAEPLT